MIKFVGFAPKSFVVVVILTVDCSSFINYWEPINFRVVESFVLNLAPFGLGHDFMSLFPERVYLSFQLFQTAQHALFFKRALADWLQSQQARGSQSLLVTWHERTSLHRLLSLGLKFYAFHRFYIFYYNSNHSYLFYISLYFLQKVKILFSVNFN